MSNAALLKRRQRFSDEHIDDRRLEFGGNVRADARVERLRFDLGDYRSLQAAKAEVEVSTVQHRSRQLDSARRALFCQCSEFGPTRITETQQLGGLVERLA